MYTQYQNDQFFLPFSVNCSQVPTFQIMSALCPHGQGEGGGGGQLNMDRPGQGEGSPKIPKFVRASFMDDPLPERQLNGLTSNILFQALKASFNSIIKK